MKYLLYFLLFSTLIACQNRTRALYQKAIQTAMYPTEKKVSNDLVAIRPSNSQLTWKTINGRQYVLMVSWKKNVSYYKNDITGFYNTGRFDIWVTAAPELLERMRKEAPKDTDLRLRQLLGLPPTAQYEYFVEFWVEPQHLYRPCPDPEITDQACAPCFNEGPNPRPDSGYIAHKAWINALRSNSYYACDLYDQYPWTQLGYTYDWNPQNRRHIGLSEFVIAKNSPVIVHKTYTTAAYLGQINDEQIGE